MMLSTTGVCEKSDQMPPRSTWQSYVPMDVAMIVSAVAPGMTTPFFRHTYASNPGGTPIVTLILVPGQNCVRPPSGHGFDRYAARQNGKKFGSAQAVFHVP